MKRTSLRILIVEDEFIARTILQEFIENEGHTVCGIAEDSREVLQAIETTFPDVIFMDLFLKDGPHGLKLTRHITSVLKLPVIIISGVSGDEELEEVPASGALSFLKKPIDIVSLRMNLSIAVRHHDLQKELAENEEKYRTIYDNAAMGIYLSSPKSSFLACNRAFTAILGYDSPDELLRLLRNQDEQFYDKPGRKQELLALLREKGSVSDFESEVMGRDGELLWISESCTPVFDAAGELSHYQGVVSDITERRFAEGAFRTMHNMLRTTINSLYEGVLVTDLDGHLIMANSAAETMLGEQAKVGKKLPFLVDLPEGNYFARFQKDFTPQADLIPIIAGRAPVHCIVVPYKSDTGEVVGAVHVLRL
jgi:PAS domain S-box-containing protein